MSDLDIEKYCAGAIERGATSAKQICPDTIVTAAWVRMKCQFGCSEYGKGYACPPYTPAPEQTRAIVDCYNRAILFHIELPKAPDRRERIPRFLTMLMDLEGEMFKDGYYKALAFLSGPCRVCKECARLKDEPCSFGDRSRPSMEACGIDVFQTVRNNGFFIEPLRERHETQNQYGLILVD